jgi:cell shape-determining protein MreC
MPKIIAFIILISVLSAPTVVLAQDQKQAPSAWQNILGWVKDMGLFVYNKVYYFLSQQVEQRKPIVESEFNKEAQEMQKELQQEAPSWLQRLKDLIK